MPRTRAHLPNSLLFPRKIRRRLQVVVVIMAAVVALATLLSQAATAVAAVGTQAVVVRVSHPSASQLAELRDSYDLLENRVGNDYFVLGDQSTVSLLRGQGLTARTEKVLPPLPKATARQNTSSAPSTRLAAASYATFYGGYHTVDAQFQHLRDVAAAYPSLATVVDYGDSWRKTRGLTTGSDLLAVCITKKASGDCALTPSAPKPRSVLVSAIHARELATAEMSWNWIDYLTSSYGTDTAVTNLLDTTEVWVIPVLNPDGRKIVESGGNSPYLQRKNANNTRGSCRNPPTASNQYGVDLNRNSSFHWGGVGSTNTACAQEYRGTTAASEPETQALTALENKLFADRRGPNIGDAAPSTTTGTFMTYHSYAGLVLYPWGDTTADAPNAGKLRSLAAKLATYNGYQYGQGPEILYGTTGTTDDDLYGRLGVASFTTELGAAGTSCDGFTPPYSCVASRFWPQERQSLMALAQAAKGPYQ
jgi:carboxypeptidase T